MVFDMLSGRRKDREKWGDRLPPGQKVVENWPVLTYGGTPRIDTKDWKLRLFGLVENEVEFDWQQFQALARTDVRCDIHCVTSWSRMDNDWQGVRFTDLMEHVKVSREASAIIAHCYGGYTTNLLLSDVMRDNVLLATKHDGQDIPAEHGGPVRFMVPHLYFWKSAKWVNGIEFIEKDRPGFWEQYGYHMRGDPWKEERYS
jgi:DMSO/TMAO reductase YedYZ molybdopterin-dependent catalytic subunit